jgi:choline dehydrogenase-like flavoprotein
MLADAASVNGEIAARFCVIGSGMAGSAIAARLAAAKQDVLLIEAGGIDREEQPTSVSHEHLGRAFKMPLTRCIELGGTTNQWHGICAPLDAIDFEARDWIDGSGWPITRDELLPYYREAAVIHSVGDHLPLDEVSPNLRRRLKEIQCDDTVLEHKLVCFHKPPLRWKSELMRLARSGSLRCLLNATALELIATENTRVVERLVVGAGGARLIVRAQVFVVCAGGLETPRLLLNSRSRSEAGIGNDGDVVGRYLMDHPVGHYCKIRFHRPTRADLFASTSVAPAVGMMAGLAVKPERQREFGLANHYVWIRPSINVKRIDDEFWLSFLRTRSVRDLTVAQIKGILTTPDIFYRILVLRFGLRPTYRYGDLFYTTEQVPHRESRVALSRDKRDRHGYPLASVDWKLCRQDIEGFKSYTDVLLKRGLRSAQYTLARVDEDSIWDRTLASSAHHLGTARMSDHPSRGAVDRNLRVHGVANLFVCDASVFPTAGGVNPSLTITALALRLAERLAADNL